MRKINVNMFFIKLFLILACVTNYYLDNKIISLIIFIPAILFALHQTVIKPIFAVDIILFLSFNAMGLLPSLSITNGTLNWEDLSIVYAFFMFFVSIKYKAKYKLEPIGLIIILFLLFRVIGAICGLIIYNQSILIGMLTLRSTYVLLIYFPLAAFINKGLIGKKDLLEEIYKFIKLISIVYVIELISLYMGINFTNYVYDIRWGYRLRASNMPQLIGLVYIIYKMLNKETKKQDICYGILFVLEIVFINQSRILILGVVLMLAILILLNPSTGKKIFIIIFCILMSFLILNNPTIKNIIIDSISESQSDSGGSAWYRKNEKKYFDEKLSGHEWFGVGTPNMHTGEASNYSGMKKIILYQGYYMNGLYLSDLGVYAIKYYWGIVGLSSYWIFMIIAVIDTFYRTYLKKQYNIYNFLVFALLVFNTIVSFTLCYFVYLPCTYLIIFLLYYANKIDNNLKLNYNNF